MQTKKSKGPVSRLAGPRARGLPGAGQSFLGGSEKILDALRRSQKLPEAARRSKNRNLDDLRGPKEVPGRVRRVPTRQQPREPSRWGVPPFKAGQSPVLSWPPESVTPWPLLASKVL